MESLKKEIYESELNCKARVVELQMDINRANDLLNHLKCDKENLME